MPTRLAARAITFGYPRSETPVLEGLSAEFAAGTMTAITGPSGSGKSTLLYLLGLMTRPSLGQVLLDDRPVSQLADATRAGLRAHRFGFVFQDAALDPSRTVLDNVLESALYRRDARREVAHRAMALLDQLGVVIRAHHRPGEVSGGQAQRIALCRALLGQPTIILADEPTGNLDARSTEVVLHRLQAEADAGATVVIATHEDVVVRACGHLLRVGEVR